MNLIKSALEYYIQNIPHKGKRYTVKWLLRLIPFKFVRSYYGPEMSCNPKDKTNIYGISGEYGHVICDHVKKLDENSIFIDIGANYGVFSLLAGQVLKTGRVFSFEPNPHIYSHFLRGIFRNELNNIIPFHCAIGTADTFLNLSFNPIHSGLSHLSKANDTGVSVPVFNITKWDNLTTELSDGTDIHIKIDVEGYEQGVIDVLRKAEWYKFVRSIVVEIDNQNLESFGATAEGIYDTLTEDNFSPSIGFDKEKHYDEIFLRI